MSYSETDIPKWQRDLISFAGMKKLFIIEGNIWDSFPWFEKNGQTMGNPNFFNLTEILTKIFSGQTGAGYETLFYNPLHGFEAGKIEEGDQARLAYKVLSRHRKGLKETPQKIGSEYYFNLGNRFESVEAVQEALVSQPVRDQDAEGHPPKPVAFVLNYASRYVRSPEELEENENNLFLTLFYGSQKAASVLGRCNTLIVVVDKVNDLPAWFYLNNPGSRNITIPMPDRVTRSIMVENTYDIYKKHKLEANEEKDRKRFLGLTEGLTSRELEEINALIKKENDKKGGSYTAGNILEAFSLYKHGVKINPWSSLDKEKIRKAEEELGKRVKGQDKAVSTAATSLRRAFRGMSGLEHSSGESKPRGILFLAGPTGTGKTELAKAIAEFVFDDDSQVLRFDMSEYGQAHSDQKLMGAPPGYVGYEQGGQLTKAVREKPFSVLLFDEIEKAHPSIMDKFLQILEDGRLTDGQGNTVYFSETFIVFTSNIGIYEDVATPGGRAERVPVVSFGAPYNKLETEVREAIKKNIKAELINRIGNNNIVVFNWIQPEASEAILEHKLKIISENIRQNQKRNVDYTDVLEYYKKRVTDKSVREYGGRGVASLLEAEFTNPISDYICTHDQNESTLKLKLGDDGRICVHEESGGV